MTASTFRVPPSVVGHTLWRALALTAALAPLVPAQADPEEEAESSLPSAQWIAKRAEWKKKSAGERAKIRKELTAARHELALKGLPKGWSSKKSKHFLVLYHCDARYATRLAAAADMFYEWLDKEFGKVTDEVVRSPILRICQDYKEFQAVTGQKPKDPAAGRPGPKPAPTAKEIEDAPLFLPLVFPDVQDVVTFYEGGSQPRFLGPLFRPILDRYLVDKDPLLYRYLPKWFGVGLYGMLDGAKIKGRKIEWKPTDQERAAIANALRADQLYAIDQVLRLDDPGYEKLAENDPNAPHILSALVRYQLGAGKRQKAWKGMVPELMKATIAAAAAKPWPADAQVEPDPKPDDDESEAEREERVEKAKEEWDARRKAIFEALPNFAERGKAKAWRKLQMLWTKAVD